MIALVTGAASSGKSAFAERLASCLPGPHVYVATMRADGEEAHRRIERHRAQRFGLGFDTLELAESPDCLDMSGKTVLLEDVSNLLLNKLEHHLDALLCARNAVVVTNEIGCDGIRYGDFTADFIERLGATGCGIAAHADVVVEVSAGVAHIVKGSLPKEVSPWAL